MKRLLLVGGGHAHMGILKRLEAFTGRGVQVTLLSPEEVHLYSGMGPGRVGGRYSREDISFPIRELVERAGGTFHHGWAERIDPVNRTVEVDSGEELSYDVVSFNVGSVVPFERVVPPEERGAIGRSIFPAKPVACLDMARLRLTAIEPPRKLTVVGGGPGGIELAANTAWSMRQRGINAEVTLFAASRIAPRQNRRFRHKALSRLGALGVEVREGSPVERVGGESVLSGGREYPTDMSLLAIGVVPPPLFESSPLTAGESGGLLVDRYLRSVDHPEIFGGGDCIEIEGMPLSRVGVYAVRQTAYLERNISATLFGGEFTPFETGEKYLLVCNLAGGHGLGTKYGLVGEGRLVGAIKNAIDRRFVKSHAP